MGRDLRPISPYRISPGPSDSEVHVYGLSFSAYPTGFLRGFFQGQRDRKSTRLNSSHIPKSRMPSAA